MIFWGSFKNPTFKGGFHEKPIQREELPKQGGRGGGLGQFANLKEGGGGVGKKERGGVFEGG